MGRVFHPPFDRLPLSGVLVAGVLATAALAPAVARTTPQSSSSPQPKLPSQGVASPVVETLVGQPTPLDVHKRASAPPRHHVARQARIRPVPPDLERPALAGVELLRPLPRPGEPPHLAVPLPAYVLDGVVTPFLTPAPPVVCHDVRREPDLPDPRLYREVTVSCAPDNP